jgi:hypothetical protein
VTFLEKHSRSHPSSSSVSEIYDQTGLQITACPRKKLLFPSASKVERAKKSLDEGILLGSVQRIDPAIERVLAKLLVVWEDENIIAIWVVAMVNDAEDVYVDTGQSLYEHVSKPIYRQD